MIVSLVVPCLNNLAYTKKLIASIEKHKTEHTLYVWIVDNGSVDGTSDWIREEVQSQFTSAGMYFVIRNAENKGFAVAVNQGMQEALKMFPETDILVLNNDVELLDNCVDELVKAAYSDPVIGVVGGKLLFPNGTIQHAGAFLNAHGWGQHRGAGREDREFNDSALVDVEYVTGAMMYIKRDIIFEIGYLDEQFSPAFFEEVDYLYRVHDVGRRVVYCSAARAIHHENSTVKAIHGNDMSRVSEVSRKNQIKFYMKRDEMRLRNSFSEKKLLYTGRIHGDWSFCIVMRNLLKGLSRAGVDVSIAPEDYYTSGNVEDWEIKQMLNKPKDYWNRTVLRSSEGDHMCFMPPGKKRVAHTTGESTRLHRGWRDQLNHVDQVITTSSFFRDILLNNGVQSRIDIVPNSVNLDVFSPIGEKLPFANLRGFNFVSSFAFGERKNPEALLRAYTRAFSPADDVSLTIHSATMAGIFEESRISVEHWITKVTGKVSSERPRILVIGNPLDESVLGKFFRLFDCNVLTTRAEGFGNSVIEMAACGIPSIVTNYSGVTDFVTDEVGWLVDYKLVDIPLQVLPYYQNYIGGKWADIDIDMLASVMRHVYNSRDVVREKGQRALQKVTQHYSLEAVGRQAVATIF